MRWNGKTIRNMVIPPFCGGVVRRKSLVVSWYRKYRSRLIEDWFTVVDQKKPSGSGTIDDHTCRSGVLFEQSRSQRRRIASAHHTDAGNLPRRRDALRRSSDAACVNAVST